MDFSFDPSKLSKYAADDYSTSDSDSGQDEAYQKPSTDPAADDYGEFNPRKRRRTGANGKEKAALGIFASDSEDERAGPGRRWGKRRQPLRQQGVSFVSSGAQAPREEDEDDNDDDDDDDDENDEEDGEFKGPPRKRKEADGDDDDEDDYDEDDTGGVGLGFATSSRAQGLGFVPASFESSRKKPAAPQPPPSATYSASNPLGNGFVPSSAYEPVLKVPLEPEKPLVTPKPSAFSSRSNGGGHGRGGGAGAGPNPNSFGARMMAKMGYVQGQGLGKEGHGRNIIIEANLRPQGVGLGAVREKSEKERQEEKRQARLRGEVVEDSEDEAQKIKKAAAARRKKAIGIGGGALGSGASTPRRPKTKYLTVDEVKKAAPGLHIPDAFTPILDMTGPDQKLLTSASGLMTPTGGSAPAATAAAEETAEQAASRKLVRRARADVMAVLEEWQSLQNRKAYADLQAKQEKQELAELELRLQGYTAMLSAFQQLQGPMADEPMADAADATADEARRPWQRQWDNTIARLKHAADAIPESALGDMKETVANISVAALHPLVKQCLAEWDPLKDPNQHMVEGLQSIQHLLGISTDGGASDPATQVSKDRAADDLLYGHHRRRKAAATPYEVMVYRLWLPHVSAAVRQWDVVRDPDSVLSLYEVWRPVLPGFVRTQLLEQDVVRKLDEAVAKWEPKRRRHQNSQSQNLPHLWLFPWLPYLPARHLDPRSADGLVAEVKRKFRQLIDVWEFYRGVVPGLRQWKAVLRPRTSSSSSSSSTHDDKADQWRPIVMSHVLPAMGRYVRAQFRVDPGDQAPYLEVITGEFQWLLDDLLAADLVGEVMVGEVFPMWHEALYHLLTQPAADDADAGDRLDRLAQWFQWWAEEVFPPAVQRLPSVRAEFERGLVMVNEALDCCGKDAHGGLVYDADQVRARLAPPQKGPALASSHARNGHHHHHHHHHHHGHGHGHRHPERESATAAAAAAAAAAAEHEPEEMSIRHYVEEWCETHDLQFMPERRKVHAEGPLYRITARGDGKGGVLAYFKGLRLYAETKKGPVEIRVDREEDWTKLLAMAS